MPKIRITKIFDFEAGHALFGYDGKCRNVHGHSYKLSVTVKGSPIDNPKEVKNGMVIDFGDLKKIVKEEIIDIFDHSLVLNKNTPHRELIEKLSEDGHRVISVDFQPTSENLVIHFVEKIRSKLPQEIELIEVKLQETETSFAQWILDDNL